MFPRTLARSAVVALATCLCSAAAARADFALVSQDLTINQQTRTAAFSLTFNQTPDFKTVEPDGTPANSFQVEFDGQATPSSSLPTDLTAVIRGDEIHVGGNLRIRSPRGDGGANSGGWGPVVGAVPFSMTGDTVAFEVPAADLGWNGGQWQASFYSLAAGSLTAQQTVSSIPAPPAFWGGLAGLGLLAAWTLRQRQIRRRGGAAYFAGRVAAAGTAC